MNLSKISIILFAVVFIIISASLCIYSCSTATMMSADVSQSEIYQIYNVSFYKNENSNYASATFRAGGITGTTLELSSPSTITHSLYTLGKSFLSGVTGTFYSHSESNSVFQPTHTFVFTDLDGSSFTNSITYREVSFDGSIPSSISRASGVTVSFTPAVAENEIVYVQFNITSGTSSVSLPSGSSSTIGATSVTVPASSFASVSNGSYVIYLERIKDIDLSESESSAGGGITATYRTEENPVTFTD